MSYYQLRLPKELNLEGLLQRVAAGQLQALKSNGLIWVGGQSEAVRQLRKVFEKHITAFDTCGCSIVCDEQVSHAQWNPGADSRLISTGPRDREEVQRFHLRIFHGALETLAGSIAHFVMHNSGNLRGEQTAAAEHALAEAFVASLGPYLFRSELCKHLELCKSAQPVDPWVSL